MILHCDLEMTADPEHTNELRFCCLCGGMDTLVPEGEPIWLCESCRDALPPEAEDSEPAYLIA